MQRKERSVFKKSLTRADIVRDGRVVAYSDMCLSLAFGEASNALAVVELPTDAEKPTHTRSLRHSLFQAIGTTREALIAAHCAQPAFLFAPLFLSLCLSPAFHKEI